jgi:pyruvate/2-oxoglutarate dehydrogenase complex dihydrolipoamide acyltransferase (E2) component
MGYIIRLPGLGMQQDRATLIAWYADLGDSVEEDEVVAEIETEKATFEIEVIEDGILRRTYVEEGEVRTPNDPLGIIAGENEDIADLEAEVGESGIDIEEAAEVETSNGDGASAANGGVSAGEDGKSVSKERRVSPRARKRAEELGVDLMSVESSGSENAVTADDVEVAAQESSEEERISPRAKRRAEELGIDIATIDGSGPEGAIISDDIEAVNEGEEASGRVFAAPRVRQLARERGIDIDTLSGSGAHGRITESDIRMAADSIDVTTAGGKAAETPTDTQPPANRTIREEKPFDGMRQTIADRLSQSYRNAVHVTEHREVDIETLLEAVEAAADAFDTDISMPDLLLLAVSATLSEHPGFNATFEEELHRLYEEHNICIAVDVEAGLITPVLRNVDTKSIEEVATERQNLTERALSGEYTMDDLQGGTFTVTNLGVLGVESFDPIINPPQVAILGINAIQQRAVPDGDEVKFRQHLPLDLSFDHRVVDGADAARFLGTLTNHIENPWPLLL